MNVPIKSRWKNKVPDLINRKFCAAHASRTEINGPFPLLIYRRGPDFIFKETQ